jgi:hypothetical protein
MLPKTKIILDNLNGSFTSSEMMQLIEKYEDSYLITIMVDFKDVSYVGNISELNKRKIINSIKLGDFYEVGKGLFRMVLTDCIYIFKKFEKDDKMVLLGVLAEKNEENRIDLMVRQTDILINKFK